MRRVSSHLAILIIWLLISASLGQAAYRESSSNTGSSTTATGNRPTGTTDGDWLLAWVVTDFAGTITGVPSGWDLVENADLSGPDGQTARLYEKVASSEPASWDWTLNGSVYWVVLVGAWSGRNTAGTLTDVGTLNTSSNATPISVALTGVTAANGDDLAWFAELDKTAQLDVWSFTASPTNFTERQDTDNNWAMATLHTRDNVSAGATGTLTGTATRSSGSGNAGFSGVVVALPASGGGSNVGCRLLQDGTSKRLLQNGTDGRILQGGGDCELGGGPAVVPVRMLMGVGL